MGLSKSAEPLRRTATMRERVILGPLAEAFRHIGANAALTGRGQPRVVGAEAKPSCQAEACIQVRIISPETKLRKERARQTAADAGKRPSSRNAIHRESAE